MKNYKVHFIGICGVSMTGLALYLKKYGAIVTGSDISPNDNKYILQSNGINVKKGHKAAFAKGADLVVYNLAIHNNPEIDYALNNNIKIMSRAELLGEILKHYKNSVAVSGSHGKTTTTAMIYTILDRANVKPNLHLGGNLIETNTSQIFGGKNFFVTEACEYKNSFLKLPSKIGVILNVEKEHMDFFKTFKNEKQSFIKFANSCKFVVVNSDVDFIECKNKITFGMKNGDYTAKNICMDSFGKYSYDCYYKNKFLMQVRLNIVGKHNIMNSLASIAVCKILKIKNVIIQNGLLFFAGVKRRYEEYSNDENKFIVHDYAHHPSEIKATIQATRQFYKKKLLVVFQPHTYSRTKTLINLFCKAFGNEDSLFIYKTYPAREKFDELGSAKYLTNCLLEKGINAKYFNTEGKLVEACNEMIKNGYGVLILGAGNIDTLAKKLL